MIQMNLHKALSYKKLLGKKISKLTDDISVVGLKTKASENEYLTKKSVKEFNDEVKASYTKLQDYIKNYTKVCNAITLSNATTKVVIDGKEMTVSDAINRKNNIHLEEELLRTLKYEYSDVIDRIERGNSALENKIDKLREIDAKEKLDKQSTYQLMRDTESWELVNPLNIDKEISELENSIMNFKSEVDCVLSTSNAQTIIELDIDEM